MNGSRAKIDKFRCRSFLLYLLRGSKFFFGLGASPSGKATDFDSVIRRFEPSRPSSPNPFRIRANSLVIHQIVFSAMTRWLQLKSKTPVFDRPRLKLGSEQIESDRIYPKVAWTRSKMRQTSTATFFVLPSPTYMTSHDAPSFFHASFHWKGKQIKTSDIRLYFQAGKPCLYACTFFFFSESEYVSFVQMLSQCSEFSSLL